MRSTKRLLTWALIISLSFSVGFVTDVSDNYFEISKNLDIFGKLYREINSLYVDDTDPSELMRTGIDAMLNSLDPYTNYISEREIEDYRFMSTGQYGGIGALVGKRKNKFIILEPYEDYPAQAAGLRTGDQIIAIDGKTIDGGKMRVSDVRSLLRGPKGEGVQLKVKRAGQEAVIDFNLTRDRIRIDNVPYFGMVNEEVGYISLTGFTQDAGKEVANATQSLKSDHPKLKGIILDLRGNPGGRLDEAVNVANVFVPQKETIVETRGRLEDAYQVYSAQRLPVDTEISLAVLVDRGSASASEIVAGSIQDLDRGIIIGQRSFGKGLVQKIRPLSYNTQLKVTTAKYYTPSGRCIQAINYADKHPDGSVAKIPDSLQTAFKTRNGRTVYDGGGIEPDFAIAGIEVATITKELSRQGLIFDFTTAFVAQNPNIASARDFLVDDKIYDAFKAYVREQNFDYDTEADRQLERLISTVSEESYGTLLNQDLMAFDQKLDGMKDRDLDKHRAEISMLLKQEIVQRYYYQSGAIETSFKDDANILKAVEVLVNERLYRKTLGN
ncbi:MAG: S41 family peptidase [Bacteroidota bacterium]